MSGNKPLNTDSGHRDSESIVVEPLNEFTGNDDRAFSGMALKCLVALFMILIVTLFFMMNGSVGIEEAGQQRRFVGRQSCASCHQKQAQLFAGSHHDKAMDVANEATVLGDFNDQTIEHLGITSRMFRSGQKFMVHTEGPNGAMQDFEVKYVFGVDPLQQYMVELEPPAESELGATTGDTSSGILSSTEIESAGFTPVGSIFTDRMPVGRVQVLRISWDVAGKKWFYLMPPDVKTKLEPGDPLHWTGSTQCWNTSCADCHSTDLHKNFDHHSNRFATTFSEIDVSCEACHGPASLHVHMAKKGISLPHGDHGFGLALLKTESNLAQIESCAPCHSRRGETSDTWHAGQRYDDHFICSLLSTGIYHSDGQIRDEDYVYGSFLQSKMFHNGIRCSDCHDPHSTEVKFADNRLCTSCHQHPAGKYDSPSHHHHASGSAGASCVECHMPATTYMSIDPRRDHSLRIPRPDLSLGAGTPNACTGCHLELESKQSGLTSNYPDLIVARESGDADAALRVQKIDREMAEAFDKWYPEGSSAVPRTDYYERLAKGRQDDSGQQVDGEQRGRTVDLSRLLAIDGSTPAIVRATIMDDLAVKVLEDAGDNIEKSFAIAIVGVRDRDPKVVAASVRLLDAVISKLLQRFQYESSPDLRKFDSTVNEVVELLDHDSRLVRLESARVLSALPSAIRDRSISGAAKILFDAALNELIDGMLVNNDRAATHLALGGIYERMGQPDRAATSYRTAIRIDPAATGARSNLAAFLDRRAETLAQQLMQNSGVSPTTANATKTQIEKLAGESQRLRAEDHELLRIDLMRSDGLPGMHSLHYRFAMSSYLQNDMPVVEEHLLIAIEGEPDSPMYRLALATYYVQVKKWDDASAQVRRLLEMNSQNPGYRALADQIKRER